ncbi:MAG: molybdopterin-dependent oxidoreductase [Bacteroidales bacterium]|jgi:xanthine dehydrogenase large subunit|nr:molybdopterin-dependent oxidoreductase [Bacteroidales bacterium]
MKNIDSKNHVTGKSVYVDDIPVQNGTLHGAIFGSPKAHGKIINLDLTDAESLDGVEQIFTFKDIPGRNQIGGIIEDEQLFAENEVHFIGHPIAFIVAINEDIARKAVKLINIKIDELKVITDPREAQKKGHLLIPPRTFKMGNVENEWSKCEYIFEGKVENGGQEHLYIETQGSYAYPIDNGSIKIHSSTQGATLVQKIAARVLGIPMHRIEIDVARLGGAFGGKEDQATAYACMAALATYLLQKPVKISLHRLDDMQMTGKRHPYSSDFKIGLSKDYKIKAFQTTMYQNGGAANDLSPAIMERTLFHSTNVYYIPNTKVTVYSCKTNLPPNTAFRGFGAPQGMFVIESAIAKAASELNISKQIIQKQNFIKENERFQYGQLAENSNIIHCYQAAERTYNIDQIEQEIEEFNSKNSNYKKGMSIMPICFGISFTKTPMNQARALVHIYQDGSLGISTGAIEMGQGVNTKMIQVAASVFSINTKRIKIESTNTTRVANTSPTAASSGADLNGNALRIACIALLERLIKTAAKMLSCELSEVRIKNETIIRNGEKTEVTWEQLIETAFLDRVCLTENGHYATPIIHFDKTKETGHPFAYHVYGASIVTVTVDCIRGTYEFDNVKIVHDFGNSMNSTIDNGQVEGGVVQGIGWMTMEELSFAKDGRLLSNSLSTYKVPDIYSVPKNIDITALKTEGPELALLRSKAIGEPPLMYGIGAYFALANAINSFNPNYKIDFDAPLTPEKVLMRLYKE